VGGDGVTTGRCHRLRRQVMLNASAGAAEFGLAVRATAAGKQPPGAADPGGPRGAPWQANS
jgi:hypothetical protein